MKQTKEIKRYENERFGQERALYMTRSALIRNCRFEGEEDGESALKESKYLTVEYCFFDLRYPFWHVDGLHLRDSEMTPNCRAALWYDRDITIERCNLHGIKAVRECRNVSLRDCDIDSPEFGWHSKNVHLSGGKVTSEYAFLGSDGVQLDGVDFRGKYSFQYAKGVRLKNCVLNTKDAFWHTKGARAEDCIINGGIPRLVFGGAHPRALPHQGDPAPVLLQRSYPHRLHDGGLRSRLRVQRRARNGEKYHRFRQKSPLGPHRSTGLRGSHRRKQRLSRALQARYETISASSYISGLFVVM